MKQLPDTHPICELHQDAFICDEVMLLEQGEALPERKMFPHGFRKGARPRIALGVAAQFEHEQFSLIVLQDMHRYPNCDSHLLFTVAIVHPDSEPVYQMADALDNSCSEVIVPHVRIDGRAFRIRFDDSRVTDRFELSIVSNIATSMEQTAPVALTETQLAALTSN